VAQTNAIILRIRESDAEEFERGFREHEYPLWEEYKAAGAFLAASLTRVEYGSHQTPGIANYLIVAVVKDMAAHSRHDSDPRFKAWDEIAERFQPEEPLVFGGNTMIEI
jgi:hypothetical protein